MSFSVKVDIFTWYIFSPSILDAPKCNVKFSSEMVCLCKDILIMARLPGKSHNVLIDNNWKMLIFTVEVQDQRIYG